MQSLSDDERREVLGEVIFDEFRSIREYLEDIPLIKQKLQEVDERLIRVEQIVAAHEVDIRYLRHRLA